MKYALIILTSFLLLSSAGAESTPNPKPSKEFQNTFKGCKWENVKGKTLSIWSFNCGKSHGFARLVADDALPGFVLESKDDGKLVRHIAIQTFSKEADASIDAILPAIRLASLGPHTDTCEFVQMKPVEGTTTIRYILEPTGDVKTQWEIAETKGDDMPPPCGEMGIYFVGDRYFEVSKNDPKTVIYYNMGSEIQIFDPESLKLLSK